jgi:hypothetical protein
MCISKSIYLHNYIKVKVKFKVLKFIFITFPGQFSGDCSMTVALLLLNTSTDNNFYLHFFIYN